MRRRRPGHRVIGDVLGDWLVVEPYPSENYELGKIGMMTFPTEWNNKIDVPNHQSDELGTA